MNLTIQQPCNTQTSFCRDVLAGLRSTPKRLHSKYFYDEKGDRLFQKIMAMPEYYLTSCEREIIEHQSGELVQQIAPEIQKPFDLIELGVGDGSKSRLLLEALLKADRNFTYFPIDISGNALDQLQVNLRDIGQLSMVPLEGEYFNMLSQATRLSDNRKIILFMGANIGNMHPEEAIEFCRRLRRHLQAGDQVVMGFDLIKSPHVVLRAYNDSQGITRDFNLNLLDRINREADGDFNLDRFSHYQTFDPETGACKSYLVSDIKQIVHVAGIPIRFSEGEWIFMEISQKYTIADIERMATNTGFRINRHFKDARNWFVDSVWTAVADVY